MSHHLPPIAHTASRLIGLELLFFGCIGCPTTLHSELASEASVSWFHLGHGFMVRYAKAAITITKSQLVYIISNPWVVEIPFLP